MGIAFINSIKLIVIIVFSALKNKENNHGQE